MKILIIEDEPQAAQRLFNLVKLLKPNVELLASLDSVRQSVAWLKSNPSPDLVFMDIQLADGLSFEIFAQIEIKSPVIFTTAYNEYALKAFKVNSIDYILKPVDTDELSGAFKKLENLIGSANDSTTLMQNISNVMQLLTKKYKERFVVKVGEHLKTIETTDILFFYSLEKTTFAQTRDGRKHILDFTLDQLEDLLSKDLFFRINRKYIITLGAIQDMITHINSRLKLILKSSDDNDIIVARERVQEFKDWLDR